jgi:hypothetical protein
LPPREFFQSPEAVAKWQSRNSLTQVVVNS